MKKIVTLILMLVSIFSIGYCFKYFSAGNLTANEQTIFSIFLAIASFFLSWLVSHFYYEMSHQENIAEIKKDYQSSLKIYASKAAEKVTNLSAEFTKLANYLKEEFNDEEYTSDLENLNAKKERIYSAIHIVSTLKSINDGSLSDWKGIIPEEIEEIVEEEREKVENISTLLSQYQKVVTSSEEDSYRFDDENLKEDIRQLNNKLDLAINNITGITTKPKKGSIKKEKIEKNCPSCDAPIQYNQKPIPTSRKWVKCKNCNTKLACRWNIENGFSLAIYDEEVHGIKNDHARETAREPLDEAFIEIIKEKLPSQPWPKKIRDSIALELGVPSRKVGNAINMLIERGVFKHQFNGIVYIPETAE